jgi:hypothetical protein
MILIAANLISAERGEAIVRDASGRHAENGVRPDRLCFAMRRGLDEDEGTPPR